MNVSLAQMPNISSHPSVKSFVDSVTAVQSSLTDADPILSDNATIVLIERIFMDAASVLLVVSALYASAMFVLRMASNSLQGALDTLLSIQKILLEFKHHDIPKDTYQHLLDQYEGISKNIRDLSDRINKDSNLFNLIGRIKQMRAIAEMNKDVQQLLQVVKLSVIDSGILKPQRNRMLAITAHDSDHVDDTENEWPSTPGHRKGSVPAICKCMNDDVGDIESQCTLREAQIRDRGQPMKCHHRVRHTVRRIIRNILSLQPQTKILMP